MLWGQQSAPPIMLTRDSQPSIVSSSALNSFLSVRRIVGIPGRLGTKLTNQKRRIYVPHQRLCVWVSTAGLLRSAYGSAATGSRFSERSRAANGEFQRRVDRRER